MAPAAGSRTWFTSRAMSIGAADVGSRSSIRSLEEGFLSDSDAAIGIGWLSVAKKEGREEVGSDLDFGLLLTSWVSSIDWFCLTSFFFFSLYFCYGQGVGDEIFYKLTYRKY